MDSIAANYSSSESEIDSDERDSDTENPSASSLPRLPTTIIEKYKLPPNTTKYEAMSLKNIRVNPQNWCTFLYFEWRPNRAEQAQLMNIVSKFNESCKNGAVALAKRLHFEPLHISSLGAPLSLHISLSQTIVFENEFERDRLYRSLYKKIRGSTELRPFTMAFQSKLVLLPSFAKDTLFLTLPVDPTVKSREMKRIYNLIREAMIEAYPERSDKAIQDVLCSPASTHMSIALAVNTPKSAFENLNILQPLLTIDRPVESFQFLVKGLKFDKNRQILSIPFS